MTAMTPEARYQTDPEFATLVDLLTQFIRDARYTPSELRQAVILAAIHYEYLNTRHTIMLPKEPR